MTAEVLCSLKPCPQQGPSHDLLGYVENTHFLQEQELMEEPPAPSHISRCTEAPAPGSFTTPVTKNTLVFWKEHVYP